VKKEKDVMELAAEEEEEAEVKSDSEQEMAGYYIERRRHRQEQMRKGKDPENTEASAATRRHTGASVAKEWEGPADVDQKRVTTDLLKG
jgi:hypothetical protein